MTLTKQDIKSIGDIVDVKLAPIQQDIGGLKSGQVSLQQDINEIKNDIRGLREQIQQLTITLDNFVKVLKL